MTIRANRDGRGGLQTINLKTDKLKSGVQNIYIYILLLLLKERS